LRPPDATARGGRPPPAKIGAEVAQSVEHRPEEAGVVSSILTLGTSNAVSSGAQAGGSGSVGRASPCQGEGRGFESRLPLHFHVWAGPDQRRPATIAKADAPSSSGRTADFGSVNRGSNPRGAASRSLTWRRARVVQGAVCKTAYTGSIPVVASTSLCGSTQLNPPAFFPRQTGLMLCGLRMQVVCRLAQCHHAVLRPGHGPDGGVVLSRASATGVPPPSMRHLQAEPSRHRLHLTRSIREVLAALRGLPPRLAVRQPGPAPAGPASEPG
jgi:hypothetical protein